MCGIIGLLSSIALPRLLLAKQAAGAASAIGSMRTINSAQLTFALTCGNGFYAPNLTTLGTPPPGSNEPFISAGLGAADTVIKSGYTIQLEGDCRFRRASGVQRPGRRGGRRRASGRRRSDRSRTNPRFFATNANGTIYEARRALCADMPEVGEPPSGQSTPLIQL